MITWSGTLQRADHVTHPLSNRRSDSRPRRLAPRSSSCAERRHNPPALLDGPSRHSPLEHLVGHWRVTREQSRKTVTTSTDADWVLNHQFVRLHYHDARPTASSYEAMVCIGRDNTSDRYVVHWLDLFGGRTSETLGYGMPVPNGIRFAFEYPEGPFVNTFTFDGAAAQWSTLMRQRDARWTWRTFARERFTRAAVASGWAVLS